MLPATLWHPNAAYYSRIQELGKGLEHDTRYHSSDFKVRRELSYPRPKQEKSIPIIDILVWEDELLLCTKSLTLQGRRAGASDNAPRHIIDTAI